MVGINLFGTTDWTALLYGSGVKAQLTSSTTYTITTRLGVDLQLTGAGLKGQAFFGRTVLSAGKITAFTLTYKGRELAAGSGYGISARAFDNAAITYVLQGDRKPLVDLFMSVEKSVAGSARDIQANLDRLHHYGKIAAIDVTRGKVKVGAGTFALDRTVLDKIHGGFALADSAAHVAPVLAKLGADRNVKSIALTGGGTHTLSVTAAQAKAGGGALAKIHGPYVLEVHNKDQSWTVKGRGDNLNIVDIAGRDTITGGGGHETFVFRPHFGQATVTDFSRHLTGATHDTIDIAKTDFSSFAALLQSATQAGSAVVFTDADGDKLTIGGTTIAALSQHAADFKFV